VVCVLALLLGSYVVLAIGAVVATVGTMPALAGRRRRGRRR
jgi:hypothetical protein